MQETLTRGVAFDRFEERSSLRTWLFRIATNVCFDALDAGKRRACPMDLSGPWAPDGHVPEPLLEFAWPRACSTRACCPTVATRAT
ncbi:MAG: sigma factor [Acidimicrobiia bacterium]